MPHILIRYQDGSHIGWGVLHGTQFAPLDTSAQTTEHVLTQAWDDIWASTPQQATRPVASVRLLAPITHNQQFLCQGVNYASHVRESGQDPNRIGFNMFFTKAASSIVAADAPVVRPPHVRLLDYEIELGLVLRRPLPAGTQVSPDDLGQWLAGLVIVNDISARDVQLPQGQFYKGKSYRGFGPVGPYLLLPTPEEWTRWPELHMRLVVNGEVRQDAFCADMIHPPHATLIELAQLQDLHAGDLVATGTPAGCAAKAPGRLARWIVQHLVSEAVKWRIFIQSNLRNRNYLQPGDRIYAAIHTDDRRLDLGEQTTTIV